MMWKLILVIVVVLCIVMLLIGIIDGNRFVVVKEEFTLSGLKKGCCFVMISDLHNKVYGKDNQKVMDAIKKAEPDFVVIAGDLVTSHAKESMEPGIRLAKELSLYYKVYYALGNHETKLRLYPEKYKDMYRSLAAQMQQSGVEMLVDESCMLPEYGICMTGLELERAYFKRFEKKPMEKGHLEQHIGTSRKEYCNILIAHNPDYFEEYAAWGADLVLSGHVHGGIMRLPFLGGVIAPSYRLFPKYDGGVFREGKSTMLLGRGMGAHTLPFRFFNPAQLYVVTLK